jgi:hypothetical protein
MTWLERELENKSIAEVSVYYAIMVMASFMFFMLALAGIHSFELEENTFETIAIIALIILLGVLVRLYWSIVKIGRIKLREKPGGEIFKIINFAFVAMTIVTFIIHGGWSEGAEPFWLVLLAFDIFVLFSGLFFFPMVWMIDCKIPKKTYLDFAIMALMVVIQIWIAS